MKWLLGALVVAALMIGAGLWLMTGSQGVDRSQLFNVVTSAPPKAHP